MRLEQLQTLNTDDRRAIALDTIGRSVAVLQTMVFPPVKYVVPGFIVEGLTLLAGKPKRGKSWLMLHAAIAVARGGYTLGDIKCDEGDVLYAALEDNDRRLQSRLDKLLGTGRWPERLRTLCAMPRLNEGGVGVIKQWLEQSEHPRLVIIDTLAKVKSPKKHGTTEYEADYLSIGELQRLAGEAGIAIVLVHHQRKMDAEDPLDSVSGTTGLTGSVDTVLVLHHEPQGVRLYGRGRDLEEVDKVVTFNRDACTWTVMGETADVRRTSQRAAILVTLEEAGEPMTPAEIAAAAGMKPANVRQLILKMARDGEVRKKEGGKYTL